MSNFERKTEVAAPGAARKAHCNKCLGDTNHLILHSQTTSWKERIDLDDGWDEIEGADTYSLLQCGGCEEVRLLHEHWFSEDWGDNGAPEQYEEYYPPALTRRKPDWVVMGLPIRLGLAEFGDLIDEIYRALGVKSLRLAAMGIRSLVEKMMIDKVGDLGRFEKNMEAFFEAGYVAKVQQDIFRNTLVEAGHAAMHREWDPTEEDLNTLLDIVEGLIKAVYVDPARAEKVGKRLPPRAQRAEAFGASPAAPKNNP